MPRFASWILSFMGLALALPAAACPNWTTAPSFGQISLNAGFLPDPVTRTILAGGSFNLENCDAPGVGYVASSPDVDLYYSGGATHLRIAVDVPNSDAVLLVNDALGNWWYDDDTYGTNPQIFIPNPVGGLYNIWIGTFSSASSARGTLFISEQ